MKICPFCETDLANVPNFGVNNRLCPNVACHELVVPLKVLDKEEKSGLGKDDHPDCFSYYDGRDGACRRCGVREQCVVEFEATRPECYGLHPNEFEECADCLDASQCVESSKKVLRPEEVKLMTRKKRTRVRRRPAAQPEPVVVAEEEEVEEVEEVEAAVDDEADLDYTEWSIPELREELEVRELETKGRKSVLVKRLLADDAELEDGGDEIVEPEPAPKQRKRTKVKDVIPDEPVEEDPAAAPVVAATEVDVSQIVAQVMAQVAAAINAAIAGGPVAVASVAVADTPAESAEPQSKGLRGAAFDHEVQTEEYTTWYETDAGDGVGWKDLDVDAKYELADTLDVDWDEHDDARVDNMRMTVAVQKHLNIVKFKDEYKSPSARKALR